MDVFDWTTRLLHLAKSWDRLAQVFEFALYGNSHWGLQSVECLTVAEGIEQLTETKGKNKSYYILSSIHIGSCLLKFVLTRHLVAGCVKGVLLLHGNCGASL